MKKVLKAVRSSGEIVPVFRKDTTYKGLSTNIWLKNALTKKKKWKLKLVK